MREMKEIREIRELWELRELRITLFAILLLLVFPLVAFGEGNVNATISAARANITVGDVVPLQVAVTHPQGWRVVFPNLENKWGDLEIRQQSAPVITQNADGTETTTTQIEVTYFRPGTVTTPELNLTIADTHGQVQSIFAAPVTLEVKSVLTENDRELRDIKPQAELWQLSSSPLPLIGSLALAFTILGGAVVLAWKHRPIPDKRTPRQRALDYLKALELAPLNEPLDVKFVCVRVSEVLREYLDKGCNIPAQDLTTGELAQELKTRAVPSNIASQLIHILRVCDDVKFANDLTDSDAIQSLNSMAQQIVVMYPPAPAPDHKGKKSREVKA